MKYIKPLGLLLLVTISFCALTACSSSIEQVAEVEEIATVLTWQEQYDLGMKYLSEGNYQEAIIAFTAAIELEPTATAAYIGRGEAYIGSGETEDNLAAALADYQSVLTIDEAEALAYLGIADVYIRMGAYDLALEILQQGLIATNEDSRITDKLAEIESGMMVDSSAQVRRKSTYNSETGKIKSYTEYSYNELGLRHMWTNWTYQSEDGGEYTDTARLDNYCLVTFDDENLVEAYHFYDENDTLLFRDSFLYNEQGLKSEQYRYSASEDVSDSRFVFYYNELGQRTRYERYNEEGLDGYWITEYDEDGNFIQELQYSAEGELLSYSVNQ